MAVVIKHTPIRRARVWLSHREWPHTALRGAVYGSDPLSATPYRAITSKKAHHELQILTDICQTSQGIQCVLGSLTTRR